LVYLEIILKGEPTYAGWMRQKFLSEALNENIKRTRMVSQRISNISEVYDALKGFFNVDRTSKK
jgi:hypothetical protein